MREIFVVIPANGRHQMISELLTELFPLHAKVILIDNGAEPPLSNYFEGDVQSIIECRGFTKNIQKWWNLGWEEALRYARGDFAVAFLNSDAMTTAGELRKMVDALDKHDASVVFFDHTKRLRANQIARRTEAGPGPWAYKMTGWGFVVRGELETRFDENMTWWYGDDDFDWRARQEFGGVVMIPGVWISNRDPNGAQRDNPELNEQIEKDQKVFWEKWGQDILDENVYSAGWIENG